MLNALLRVAAVLCAVAASDAGAAERRYFIAIEEIDWDYAPAGRDQMMGMGFHGDQRVFVTRSANRTGRVYRKVLYREYTDASFTTRQERPAAWSHLGLLRPVIRAEVGDTVTVVLRNKASRPYSLHPHGVRTGRTPRARPMPTGRRGPTRPTTACRRVAPTPIAGACRTRRTRPQ
ncbi:MAG: hypothetical protein FJX67_02930 [Alphaproteobacteria bacterium]|nr:hypothetical protein [Alphaproteobacteria bacterium]